MQMTKNSLGMDTPTSDECMTALLQEIARLIQNSGVVQDAVVVDVLEAIAMGPKTHDVLTSWWAEVAPHYRK